MSFLALALAAVIHTGQAQDQTIWPGIETGEWSIQRLNFDGTRILFAQPGPRHGLIWTRHEYKNITTERTYKSVRTLVEINCETTQTRTVQLSAFESNNLLGRDVQVEFNTAWEYAAPDTIASAELTYGCGE